MFRANSARSLFLLLAVVLSLGFASSSGLRAQGIVLEDDAVILFGSTANCTKPAKVDFKKVRKKTPEWKKIRSEGVQKGTARYSLLISEMNKRIKKHCKTVAQDKGHDCVVRKGDVSDSKGLTVDDMTAAVVTALESDGDDS